MYMFVGSFEYRDIAGKFFLFILFYFFMEPINTFQDIRFVTFDNTIYRESAVDETISDGFSTFFQ